MNLLGTVVVIVGAVLAAALIIVYPRLRRLASAPVPLNTADSRLLATRLPWYPALDARQQDKLQRLTARLLGEVRFIGCGGLNVSRDMRLLIAGQASVLCLGAQPAHFDLPSEILVYPDAFYIHHDTPDEHGLVDDLPMLASGEAWQSGRVILSWTDIEAALAGADHNVVLHEFAHLLDFAAPEAEGAPPMADFGSWANAFSAAFERLREAGSPVIDVYGAENPTEFFAVAVEAFFQRGAALAKAHGDLYQVMAAYFDIDTSRARPRFAAAPATASGPGSTSTAP